METGVVSNLLTNLHQLVKSFTSKLKENVLTQTVEESLEEIKKRGKFENNEAVSELEQAKLLNLNAYLLVSLFFTHLKVNGNKLDANSVVTSEIKRVKEFMDMVKLAEESLLKQEESDAKKNENSERFINKHFGSCAPAVSKAHFEDKTTEKETKNIHVRFEEKEEQQELAGSLKKEQKGKKKSSNKVSKPSFKTKNTGRRR